MNCQAKWIGLEGKPTPDQNRAIAIAHAHKAVYVDGRLTRYEAEIAQSFPVCADHLPQLRGLIGPGKGWSVTPLPAESEWPEGALPKVIVDAILKRWPDQAGEILPTVRQAYDHYYFERWGMYVGIEYDGYIHT